MRIFVIEGREYPDPDSEKTPEEVKMLWADFMPELISAEVIEHKRDEDTLYELKKRVGTKG